MASECEPLLIEGPQGGGKTELGRVLAGLGQPHAHGAAAGGGRRDDSDFLARWDGGQDGSGPET